MYFSNTGTTNSPILEKILPLDLHLPSQSKDGFVLHHTAGEFNSAKSFAPLDKVFTPGTDGTFTFAPRGGRSSDGEMPFFNVDWHSGGVAVAVGWSGQWEATCSQNATGAIAVQAGQQVTHFTLHPGETVRTPTPAARFLEWRRSRCAATRYLFRQVLLQHYSPRRKGQLIVYPPICASVNKADPEWKLRSPPSARDAGAGGTRL